jgi:hypothetical protein
MYFDLLGLEDRQQFNASEMQAFGADRGEAVFAALEAAAMRGVQMRILLGTLNDPMNSTEVRTLLSYPSVKARTWNPVKWYDGGIMHMKLWHSNGRAAYLGSANTDWKSLAQVQELGVLVNGTAATADLGRLFETFWKWASPDVPAQQMIVFSDKYAAPLTLPPWDINVPLELRVPMAAPFDLLASSPLAALSSVSSPQLLCPDEEDPEAAAANAYVSASLIWMPSGRSLMWMPALASAVTSTSAMHGTSTSAATGAAACHVAPRRSNGSQGTETAAVGGAARGGAAAGAGGLCAAAGEENQAVPGPPQRHRCSAHLTSREGCQ